jgi:4-hydroxybenzoate polyprenyltransferase
MGRIEGPPLAGILVLAGAVFIDPLPSIPVFIAACCMAVFCMNYVYLVNGVTDVKEDAINSPHRPLSRGVISVSEGWGYTWLLFGITLIYPLLIHTTWAERILVWIILGLGYIYSCPPVRFKRFPPLATLYLVVNFNLPLVLGYWMASGTTDWPPFLLSTVLLFLANMPLKDYGDRVGDEKAGVKNWVQVIGGTQRLLLFTSLLSVLGAVVCYYGLPLDLPHRWLFVGLPLLPALNIGIHRLMGWNMDQMFTHGVRTLIVLATVYVLFQWANS